MLISVSNIIKFRVQNTLHHRCYEGTMLLSVYRVTHKNIPQRGNFVNF